MTAVWQVVVVVMDSGVWVLGCGTGCVLFLRVCCNDIWAGGAGSLATSLCALTGLTILEYVCAYACSRVRCDDGSMSVLLV